MAKHITMNSGTDMSENDNLEEQYVKISLPASFPCTLNMFRKRVKNVVTSMGIEVGIECK
jgi:hypothetical protein